MTGKHGLVSEIQASESLCAKDGECLKNTFSWGMTGVVLCPTHTHTHVYNTCSRRHMHATHPHTVGKRGQSMVCWNYFIMWILTGTSNSVNFQFLGDSLSIRRHSSRSLEQWEEDCASRTSTEKTHKGVVCGLPGCCSHFQACCPQT